MCRDISGAHGVLYAFFPCWNRIRRVRRLSGTSLELMFREFDPIEESKLASAGSEGTALTESGPICSTGERSI